MTGGGLVERLRPARHNEAAARKLWAFAAAAALVLAGCGGGTTIIYVTPPPTEAPAVVAQPPDPEPSFGLGSGVISFGTSYDPDTLTIPKPLTRFKRTYPEIAWSADMYRAIGATSMTWVIVEQSSSGAETTLIQEEQDVGSPDYTILANAADLAFLLDNKAGTYVMRYIESGDVLAEGAFTLVK